MSPLFDALRNSTDSFDSHNITAEQLSMLLSRLSELQTVCLDVASILLENHSMVDKALLKKISRYKSAPDEINSVALALGISVLIVVLVFILTWITSCCCSPHEESAKQELTNEKEERYITLGRELDLVENFLNRIHKNPAIDGHLLLLDGPPGTGKTSLVLKHLKSLGYPVHEWVRGNENDMYAFQMRSRVSNYFKYAKTAAKTSKKPLQVLFIDEIDGVIQNVISGSLRDGFHSTAADNKAFLAEITALQGHRVVLIGATNFPNQLPHAVLSRAGMNRIHFLLPTEFQRKQLLTHFFREKQIEPASIGALSRVAVGYSPRELLSFVESIEEQSITFEMVKDYFNRYARTLREDFRAEFECAEIFMPSFQQEDYLKTTLTLNPELKEQFQRIQQAIPLEPKKHTLLYGPSGGGKTTAVKIFAQSSGQILISVNAGQEISKALLAKIFDRVKQLGRVILFFDEMDRIADPSASHTAFLQTEMDGITTNDITIIGATNYPENFEPAILSRFSRKIFLPKLDKDFLSLSIKQALLESIKLFQDEVYFDESLAGEMEEDSCQLAAECDGLDWRGINAAIYYLLGDLKREKPHSNLGITYLRLQDICFSFYIMKIQEKLITASAEKARTVTQYISENRLSFFPMEIPKNGTHALDTYIKNGSFEKSAMTYT